MRKSNSLGFLNLKPSVKIKLFLATYCASLLVALAALWLLYFVFYDAIKDGLRNEITAIARTAAASINGNEHRLLELSKDEKSPLYRKIKNHLNKIKQANPRIRYIYTMTKTDKPNIWQFIVDAEENPKLVSHLGDKYDISDYPEMQRAFDGPIADKEFNGDKWGTWLSGYAPIYNSSGKAIAIVGIDMSANNVKSVLAKQRKALIAPMLTLILMPALLGWIVSRGATKSLSITIDAAKKIALGDYDQKIPVTTRDEIGELAEAMNNMAIEIRKRVGSAECMVMIDSLTNLYNHRYFQDKLDEEIERADRRGHKISLLVIDIDDFDKFNEVNGHARGDKALKQIAELIKQSIRDNDFAARYSGEEFTVILPKTGIDEARLIAEKINTAISTHRFSAKHNVIYPLTVGIGIASYPDCGETSQDLINAGYMALAEAKKTKGRQPVYCLELDKNSLKKGRNTLRSNKDKTNAELLSAVFCLIKAVDARDQYTRRHSEFVAKYAAALGRAIGLEKNDIEVLSIAGLLHDIGKIGIPDSVLNKPGRLTDEEWSYMTRHPVLGADIIRGIKGLPKEIIRATLHHHERYDGAGYLDGMKGEDIPLTARILTVVDSYHAMISDRPYRQGLSPEEAIEELMKHKGTQFDAYLVDKFVELIMKEQAGSKSKTQAKLIKPA